MHVMNNEYGHYANKCPSRGANLSGNKRKAEEDAWLTCQSGHTSCLTCNAVAVGITNLAFLNRYIIDTGATKSITSDQERLTNKRKYCRIVTYGDGQQLMAKYIGTINSLDDVICSQMQYRFIISWFPKQTGRV